MTSDTDKGGSKEDICGVCKKDCESGQQAMSCDTCEKWFHITCEKIPQPIYEVYRKKGMEKYNFYWNCKECSEKSKENLVITKYVEKTNQTLATLQKEIMDIKEMQKESGITIKKELEKMPSTYAQVTGTGIQNVDHFATRVANTQKRITEDREARQNNIIIFNMDEKTFSLDLK